MWLLQRQVVCDRLLCPLFDKKNSSPQPRRCLFSPLQPLLIFRFSPPPAYPRSRLFSPVWIKSSIYQSQTNTQSLADSLAFDQLSLRERRLIEPGHMWAPPRSPFRSATENAPPPLQPLPHTPQPWLSIKSNLFSCCKWENQWAVKQTSHDNIFFFKMPIVQYHLQM